MTTEYFILIINLIVTISCGGYILYSIYVRKIAKHIFYYLFSVGFIIYGFQIFIRSVFPDFFVIHLMMWGSFLLFSLGFWCLNRKKIFSSIIVIIYSVAFFLICAWKTNIVSFEFASTLGLPLGYIPLVLFIAYHRVIFGKATDKFVFGWALLFLANFTLYGMGWVCDVFAIFSKIVLLFGIREQDFVILTQRVREEMISHPLPHATGYRKEGGLKLIISSLRNPSYAEQVDWIGIRIQKNVKDNVDTCIFSFQDVMPHKELRRMKWISPEKVFIFLFSTSAEKVKEEFTVLPMGMTQIGTAISEVIKRHPNSEEGCTVIFDNLSHLIHLFGAYPVYNLLLNKMGALREEGVELFAFFQPETHSDKSIIFLFTSISDEVIRL